MNSKLTLIKIYNAYCALQNLTKEKLPIKISYAIYKNINNMKNEIEFFENEKYKLGDEYVERDKNNNPIPKENMVGSYKIIKGKESEYNEKILILMNTEVEIEIYKINIDILLNSDIVIEPTIFESLDYIFE